MTELLALPAWDTPPTSLDAWSGRFANHGHPPVVSREGSGVAWMEFAPLRLRAYVVIESGHVEAVNFEINDPDPQPSLTLIVVIAQELRWELHPDDGSDDEDDS